MKKLRPQAKSISREGAISYSRQQGTHLRVRAKWPLVQGSGGSCLGPEAAPVSLPHCLLRMIVGVAAGCIVSKPGSQPL